MGASLLETQIQETETDAERSRPEAVWILKATCLAFLVDSCRWGAGRVAWPRLWWGPPARLPGQTQIALPAPSLAHWVTPGQCLNLSEPYLHLTLCAEVQGAP